MDIARLKPNEIYWNLKPNYAIFLCTFDLFGHQLYRYTRCVVRKLVNHWKTEPAGYF